jgi:LysM repeat protein
MRVEVTSGWIASALLGLLALGQPVLADDAPAPPVAPTGTAEVTYTVGPNDSLSAIAKHFGVTWQALAAANHLAPPYEIRQGQKLQIPPATEPLPSDSIGKAPLNPAAAAAGNAAFEVSPSTPASPTGAASSESPGAPTAPPDLGPNPATLRNVQSNYGQSYPQANGAAAPTVVAAPPAAVVKNKDDRPLYFEGLDLEVDVEDSSGLNAAMENYENDWILFFVPSWSLGRRYFKDNDYFSSLKLSAKWLLTGEFAGVNPAYRDGNFIADSFYDGCDSAATSDVAGQADVYDVPYCQNGSGRRLDFSDVSLKISDKIYTIPVAEIGVNVALRGVLPTSVESQNQGLITGLGPTVGINRDFFDGKLHLSYDFLVSKFFFSRDVGSIAQGATSVPDLNNPENYVPSAATLSADPRFAISPGPLLPDYSIGHIFTVGYDATDTVSFTAFYWISDAFGQQANNFCNQTIDGLSMDVCAQGAAVAASSGATLLPRGDAGSQRFSVSVDYQLTTFLTLEASLLTVAPQRHPDGSWQQPFLVTNYNGFSTINLGLNFTTDALIAKAFHLE